MTNEEFAEELVSVLSYNRDEVVRTVLDVVKRKLEDTPPPTAAEIVKAINDSSLVHNMMCDWAKKWVANEIGNRLRCGIWNGTTVDKLFDSIWTEQLDVAIKDRIRTKVYAAIDTVIAERLKGLKA